MPSMRCLAGVGSDVSLPLYSACCLHAAAAAAVRAGGGAVPAASYRILGVAAAKKGDRRVTRECASAEGNGGESVCP